MIPHTQEHSAQAAREKQKVCCIVGCEKTCSIRNFASLKSVTWKVKPDMEQAASKREPLKICTMHYNEDLRQSKSSKIGLNEEEKETIDENSANVTLVTSSVSTIVLETSTQFELKGKRRSSIDDEKNVSFNRKRQKITQQEYFKTTSQVENSDQEQSIDWDAVDKQRFMPNMVLSFNLANEPCLKYNLSFLRDRDFFARMAQKVLFLESQTSRYELSMQHDNPHLFRWAECTNPLLHSNDFYATVELPLRQDYIKVLEEGVTWSEISWGPKTIVIRGNTYKLERFQFVSRSQGFILDRKIRQVSSANSLTHVKEEDS